jgi:opacity protein-like surface antigen
VIAFLAAPLFCSMASAAEAPTIETERRGNQQLQQAKKTENEETLKQEGSVETSREEQPQARSNEEGDEEEGSAKEIQILSNLPLVEKVTLAGFIDLDYDYYEVSDVSEKDSTGRTDLGLGSVDLELRMFFNEWLKAKITVAADDVGKQESENKIVVDDAFFTLNCPWVPLYFKGGYTVLPFGVFEDRLITGTILEDLYEIQQVGATLGFSPDFYGLDISFTVYAGQDIIKNLRSFDIDEYSTAREKDDDVSSFIANLTLEPVEEMLSLSVFYDCEPGDGRRNQTIGSALALDVWKFSLDGEYITALQREKGDNGKENRESAWVAGLAFRPSESVPVEIVVRYEDFDDDIKGNQDEILDDRYVAGISYKFLEWATFFFEYDYLNYEKERDSDAADHAYELHFRIGFAF